MKFIILNLSFCFVFFLNAQEVSLNSTNTIWYESTDRSSFKLAEQSDWQKINTDSPLISAPFPETPGISLKNYEIAIEPLPRMLPVAIYPPAGGIVRFDERELSRYIEFVDEEAYISDNTIEYQLTLEGRWTLDPKYRNEEWMIEFRSGYENWVELIYENQVLASGKSQVIVQGSEIPETGSMQIRCNSWTKNNKGLIRVRVFKAYEQIIPDRFHQGPQALLESGTEWQWATSKTLKPLQTPMESTPVLYKRIYTCKTANDTKNAILEWADQVTHVYLNGTLLNLSHNLIPDNLLKVGDNEVIYYSTRLANNLNNNLKLTQLKPYFLRTTLKATKTSTIKVSLRGVRSKVYINGEFAGIACSEKPNEALGLGLFKDGDNEIVLCLLQNSQKAFLESINIANLDDNTAMILPWEREKGSQAVHYGHGASQPYEGALLSRGSQASFSTKFSLPELPQKDLQLVFNSNNRLPTWLFKEKVSAPYAIELNGKTLLRNGQSFILPASDLKMENTISFDATGNNTPEPLLFLKAIEDKESFPPILTLTKRHGQNILNPKKFFTGETLVYKLTFNPAEVDKLSVTFDQQKTSYTAAELKKEPTLKLSFNEAKNYTLLIESSKNGQKIKDPIRKTFEVKEFPENTRGWLRANGQYETVTISETAFFDSEAMLFPGKFIGEWSKRELYSDSDDLNFGPIKSWQLAKTFSLYGTLPNGQFVFDKFYSRLDTYLKIKSRGLPTRFKLEQKRDLQELWNSAAFTLQYLKWLEKNGTKIDWQMTSLEDLQVKYVKAMPGPASNFIAERRTMINSLVKQMALKAAPGSTFEEEVNQ
ncbi:MAG: hypothetical protein MK132_22515 [Lentisphaerales bacterium]|nr:hypothetical protein [Lentisphaerales bacterium]